MSVAAGSSRLITDSFTYHAPKPTVSGPYVMGIDEAGRGPVLGPLVYGVAYCTVAFRDEGLDELGFADSKTLTAEIRSQLLQTLGSHPDKMSWAVRVLCPQQLSAGMLRVPPTNLNRQSEEATVLLIREVLQLGIELTEIFVDALGPAQKYQDYLSSLFPSIAITVRNKADSLFKIVGAASVAAKVTRDECIEGWLFEEAEQIRTTVPMLQEPPSANVTVDEAHADVAESAEASDASRHPWGQEFGSGYPGDPRTVAWLDNSMDRVFGYPSLARFSWSTIKNRLAKSAYEVKWIDEGQDQLISAFLSEQGRDKGRCSVTKELAVRSVGSL